MRVLLVEDEAMLAEAIKEVLAAEGYAVDLAVSGSEADELVSVNSYDLVVLDWGIPPPTGIELLRAWRERGDSTPVLMLTGRGTVGDKVDGLDTGADDYLTKPFRFAELLARVRSLLRRRTGPVELKLEADDIVLDLTKHLLLVHGEEVGLRPKEFAMLEYLLGRLDQVVTRRELIDHVWDQSFDSFSNVVDVTVHRVRKKIDGERPAKLLQTVKGVGYMLRSVRR